MTESTPVAPDRQSASTERAAPEADRSLWRAAWRRLQGIDPRVWLTLLLVFAALFLIRERDEIRNINRVLRSANPWWVLGMVVVAVAMQVLFTLKDILVYRLMSKNIPVLPLI